MTVQMNAQKVKASETITKAMSSRPAKFFYIFCILALIIYIFIISSQFAEPHATIATALTKKKSVKYILIWTLPYTIPFVYLGRGQKTFIKRKCSEQKCFVTPYTYTLDDIRDFDAVAFHGPEISHFKVVPPQIRSPHQIYIFGSLESSHNYPICDQKYNNFFNWTWTYRLDSDLLFGYLIVKDKEGRVVGPNEVIHWKKNDQMLPIDDTIKKKLETKHKAAAWLVSNCNAVNKREKFVQNLEREMAVHGLLLDTFGKCGRYKCEPSKLLFPDCWEVIQSDYYFYLAFENSFSKDYVTEKLLGPLQHYTVPIVYGAANYTRYMPDGAYLNAFDMGAKKLAEEMKSIIDNKEKYYSFFKWHNHYSYHDISEDPATDNYCRLCAALHANDTRDKTEDIPFTDWWNSPIKCPRQW